MTNEPADENISARVPRSLYLEIEQEALERSEPGNRVTVSTLVREILADHVDDVTDSDEEPEQEQAAD